MYLCDASQWRNKNIKSTIFWIFGSPDFDAVSLLKYLGSNILNTYLNLWSVFV